MKISTINVAAPSVSQEKGFVRLCSAVRINEESFCFIIDYYDVDIEYVSDDVDAFVSLLSFLAIGLNCPLTVEGKVSGKLISNLKILPKKWSEWDPKWQHNDLIIRAGSVDKTTTPFTNCLASRSISSFTGGVDSFYTLMKHSDELSHIFYVYGYDLKAGNAGYMEKVKVMMERVGERFRVKPIYINSNIRRVFNQLSQNKIIPSWLLNWAKFSHGPALMCVVHGLKNMFTKCYMPSSLSKNYSVQKALSIKTDHLYSSDSLSFFHDGLERNRYEKIEYIISQDVTILNECLRVCFNKDWSEYNCSRCEKCLRTMISLEMFDCLKRSKVFSKKINYTRYLSLINNETRLYYLRTLIEAALKQDNRKILRKLKYHYNGESERDIDSYLSQIMKKQVKR